MLQCITFVTDYKKMKDYNIYGEVNAKFFVEGLKSLSNIGRENMSILPKKNELGFFEIRLESIGGLGANLA